MSVELTDLLAGVIVVIFLFWQLWPSKKKKMPPPISGIQTIEEDEVPDVQTDSVYDNADSDKLFEAKLQCLQWALEDNSNPDADQAVAMAKKYWDFLVFDERADEK